MKKTLLSFAFVAASLLVSCQGQIEPSNQKESSDGAKIFTASIDNALTRTTLGDATGDPATYPVSWASGDEVTINGVTYTVTPDGTDATKATLTKTGQGADPTGTFNAFYPISIQSGATAGGTLPASQAYAAGAISNLPMYATATGTSLTFKNICAVLAVTVKKADFSPVKSVRVSSSNCALSGVFTVKEKTSGKGDYYAEMSSDAQTAKAAVILDCGTTAVDTETDGTVFYIAIPAQTYQNLKIELSADGSNYTKAMTTKKDTDIIVAVNTIYPLTFKSDDFSVSSTKSVHFTKGNLWWGKKGTEASASWHLEESQTAYPTQYWNADHVGHFFWTTLTDYQSGNASYMPYASGYAYSSQSETDKFWCGEDNKLTVDGQSGLYALSSAEWTYLISTRTNASSLYKYGVTVTNGGKSYTNCLIIAPDDYSGTALGDITDWSLSNINSLGLVCLPAAGENSGSYLHSGGIYGFYCSATPYDRGSSYYLFFYDSNVSPKSRTLRNGGHSVRLVCSVSSK